MVSCQNFFTLFLFPSRKLLKICLYNLKTTFERFWLCGRGQIFLRKFTYFLSKSLEVFMNLLNKTKKWSWVYQLTWEVVLIPLLFRDYLT